MLVDLMTKKVLFNRKMTKPLDQLLIFLAAGNGPTDPIRIMKGMFVFSRAVAEGKLPKMETFDFEAMNYGPCSLQVYEALDCLVEKGLAKAVDVPGESWKRFAITKLGADVVEPLAGDKVGDFLKKLRAWCDGQSFTGLLRAVYHAYPEFAVNSVLPHLRPN